jgi:hypothetical protein
LNIVICVDFLLNYFEPLICLCWNHYYLRNYNYRNQLGDETTKNPTSLYGKMMIESSDAVKVVETVVNNLISVANNKQNFERLPDVFWGYFARGHDSKNRKFSIILSYSEKEGDVDELIKLYEQWVAKQKQ